MNVFFDKDNLLNALGIVSKAVSARTTNPILECILFDASGSRIKLTGNDANEIGIETIVEGRIERQGKIALDAKLIMDIVRKIDAQDQPICIDVDNNFTTTISCGRLKYNIPGLDPEEFTQLPYIERDYSIQLPQLVVKDVIRQTIFSAAVNNPNKVLCGEFLKISNDVITFTALDGYRIAVRNVSLGKEFPPMSVILPTKSLNEISRILPGEMDKWVTIYFCTNHVLFEFDQTIVVSRTIDGQYMDIFSMISFDYETKIEISRQKLLNALDSSSILLRESDNKPIIMHIEENILHLSAKSQYGAFDMDLECEKNGKDLKIAFNPWYLMDAIKAIEDETLILHMSNSKSPCFMRDSKDSYNYIVLPINFVE